MRLIDGEENKLKKIASIEDFCRELRLSKGQLLYILYKEETSSRYRKFTIPKKRGGERVICAPMKGIKLAQDRLFNLLVNNILFKPCVKGFVKGEGVVRNALEHKKSRWVLNVDIENFFGSINFGRVRGVFLSKPFEMPHEVATVIAKICTFNNSLPQGAQTSPVIANIIASMLDNKILRIAKKHRLKYTRYADDITISSYRSFPRSLPRSLARLEDGESILGEMLEKVFEKSGFKVNQSKLRLQGRSNRQEVTGIIVNDKVNVPVEFKKNLRTAIHQWCDNPEKAEEYFMRTVKKVENYEGKVSEGGVKLRDNIYGRLSYLCQVKGANDSTYLTLAMKMAALDPNPPRFMKVIMEKYHMYDVFICHASEDKEGIAHPLHDELIALGMSVFIDDRKIKWGDSLVDVINSALHRSKVVIAIMTKNSIGKSWPRKEINSVLSSEIAGKSKLLALIDGNPEEVLQGDILISEKLYKKWEENPKELSVAVKEIVDKIER